MISFVDPDRYRSMKATGKLPSPKGVAFAIIKLLQRDDFRVPELVRLVQSDPAIAGRLLKFANAAAFGRTRPIVSLQRAIVALGSFKVRDLVIGLSVMHSHKSGQCTEFDYAAFWGHSLATGIACQELARFAQISSEDIFTIGLLTRVGELAMASLYPDEYSDVLIAVREKQQDLAALEQQRFAMDHRQLGATMLAEWGLPDMLIQAAYHHEQPDVAGFPDGSRLQTLTHSLNFARSLAEICMADEEARWSLLPGLLTRAARLGISGDALNDMVDRMSRRWRDWGATLQVRTQELPPFAEILAASPPSRRVSGASTPEQSGKPVAPRLQVQLLGIPAAELPVLIEQIEKGSTSRTLKGGSLDLGARSLPDLKRDSGDRNRTSPFAFTGNKFELRAVGTTASVAWPNTIINTIVADSLDFVATEIESKLGKNPTDAKRDQVVLKVLQSIIKEHKAIVFNGDNYAQAWQDEAARRGLPNLRSTADALPALETSTAKKLFRKHKVLSTSEPESRVEIFAEKYITEVSIEAQQMVSIARTLLLPAATKHQRALAETIVSSEQAGASCEGLRDSLIKFVDMVHAFQDAIASVESALEIPEQSALKQCVYCRETLFSATEVLRACGDALEREVDQALWPLPSYHDLLSLR